MNKIMLLIPIVIAGSLYSATSINDLLGGSSSAPHPAANLLVDASILKTVPITDSGIDSTLNFDSELDGSFGFVVGLRTVPVDGFSFGLEYAHMGAKASGTRSLSAFSANRPNWNFGFDAFSVGDNALVEEYSVNAFYLSIDYEVWLVSQLFWYAGAGVGVAHIGHKLTFDSPANRTLDSSDVVMAYYFDTGLRYALNDRLSLGGGLRLMGFQDAEFEYGNVEFSDDLGAVAFDLSLSYTF